MSYRHSFVTWNDHLDSAEIQKLAKENSSVAHVAASVVLPNQRLLKMAERTADGIPDLHDMWADRVERLMAMTGVLRCKDTKFYQTFMATSGRSAPIAAFTRARVAPESLYRGEGLPEAARPHWPEFRKCVRAAVKPEEKQLQQLAAEEERTHGKMLNPYRNVPVFRS